VTTHHGASVFLKQRSDDLKPALIMLEDEIFAKSPLMALEKLDFAFVLFRRLPCLERA